MEEEKAAAYYDELTRKGGGAARFKQGLGFSAASDAGKPPARGSALVSSSSTFLGGFVRASSPSKASELEKQSRLESVQSKIRKKKEEDRRPSLSRTEERREARISRSRSRSRERERRSRRRSRSRSRERYRDGDRDRDRRRRRSRSRSDSDGNRRRRERKRIRSSSPRDRRDEKRNRSRSRNRNRSPSPPRERKPPEKRNGGVDYSRLIEGYDKMSQAERVKAKTKLQLAETVEKDETKGSSGWERFEFNKDAPLDDEEIQAAEDDASLVKHIGQSFRFSVVQEKREQKIRNAHDEAMFGAPVFPPPVRTVDEAESGTVAEPETETETYKKELNGSDVAASLLSEKVLAKQQGSWRDRARKQRS